MCCLGHFFHVAFYQCPIVLQTLFFASGEVPDAEQLAYEIEQQYRNVPIIAVDGGFNHCYNLSLVPSVVIGDMDSVNQNWLNEDRFDPVTKVVLERAKDETDLEYALKAEHVNKSASIVYGGLGGRPDHSLYNLFQLLSYPGELYLVSGHEALFALDANDATFIAQSPQRFRCRVFALYGTATVDINGEETLLDHFGTSVEYIVDNEAHITVTEGTPLILLTPDSLPSSSPVATFLTTTLSTATEQLLILPASNAPYFLDVIEGQTLSLFPLFAPAKVDSSGLFWELSSETHTLNNHFLSLSNISTQNSVTLTVTEGVIVCFLTHTIDSEMFIHATHDPKITL